MVEILKKFLCIAVSSAVILCTALSGCMTGRTASATELMFDTVVSIKVTASGTDRAEEILKGAIELCKKYDEMLDMYNDKSELSRINSLFDSAENPDENSDENSRDGSDNNSDNDFDNNSGVDSRSTVAVEVSDDIRELLEASKRYYDLSGGSFDVTVAPISKLWNTQSDTPRVPKEEEISSLLETVGFDRVKIEGNTVTAPVGTKLDFGGIAKGFVAGKITEFIRLSGASGVVINLGGNVTLSGNGTHTVGIQKPFSDTGELAAKVEVTGERSVVTSGSYQRYFVLNGKLYHHIIDPETGSPAQSGLSSVTVISSDHTAADALSTALFVLGYQKGVELLKNADGVEAVFIDDQGNILLSDGLAAAGETIKEKDPR